MPISGTMIAPRFGMMLSGADDLEKNTSLQPDIGFLHCHRVNTDWKQYREESLPEEPASLELDLRYDGRILELLDRGFSD